MIMTPADPTVIVRRFYETLNAAQDDRLDELAIPGFWYRQPGVPPGLAGFRQVLAIYRLGFPDFHNTVEELIGEGDRVAARTLTSGTHTGIFLGHPPTGRHFSAAGLEVFTLRDGWLIERTGVFDSAAMFQQLGLQPAV